MKANPMVLSANKELEESTPSFTSPSFRMTSRLKFVTLRPREVIVDSVHERFIKKIINTIETHIANPQLCVSMLADESSMSTVQLYRKLKKLTGRTPNELIRDFRLARAASLLNQEAGLVAEVAYSVGFNSLSYFTKCFRATYGSCPSEFKFSMHQRLKSISY